MNKKYMFEAKRLDNGEIIEFGLFDVVSGASKGSSNNLFVNINKDWLSIVKSTIKPLFTTDKRDEWVFENADNKPLNECSPEEIAHVITADDDDLEQSDSSGDWGRAGTHSQSDKIISKIGVYRVKAPGYSTSKLLENISKSTRMDSHDTLNECIDHVLDYLKANGLVGNDE